MIKNEEKTSSIYSFHVSLLVISIDNMSNLLLSVWGENTKSGAKKLKEQEKKRKRNKDRSRREMEYRDELFSGKEGFWALHSENSQERRKKGIKNNPRI